MDGTPTRSYPRPAAQQSTNLHISWACWPPTSLFKWKLSDGILCKHVLSLGANILSLQLVLSFPKLFVHGNYIKDERRGWGGRAVGSTREQSKLNA